MTKKKIKEILRLHKKWLMKEKGGKKANLDHADLHGADLQHTTLSQASFQYADLSFSNLRGASLDETNLYSADLFGANLVRANLVGSDLRRANLGKINLGDATLRRALFEFNKFPSIALLSTMQLGILSDPLTLELMRRDAYAHPHPKEFADWARDECNDGSGVCPYQNEARFWHFNENANLWRRGKPQMRDSDLILAICQEKGWGIVCYLEVRGEKQ